MLKPFRRRLRVALLSAALLLLPHAPRAQEGYRPSASNLAARERFRDARFGLFIHWGIYSVLGQGEWVMNNKGIPVAAYEPLALRFNPTKFDAAAWVALAKAAGMKYVTVTSKHHDGFAMFDSKLTDWDVVDRTPYRRDVVRQLADECRRQGLGLFLYYSQLDWHHPDYFPRGSTGKTAGRPEAGDWNRYLDFMDGQLRELLTNYGRVSGVWFDGMWDRPDAEWRLGRTYALIHALQPHALVGSNHHRRPYPGEDFQMFEKDLPGRNTAGFNQTEVSALPLETCETMNESWGYNAADKKFKGTRELVHYLVRAAGNDANFLLNVGPRPDGTIQPEFVERLRELGAWLRRNGESVYGTRGGPVPPQGWGVTTVKGGRVYVHVLERPGDRLTLPRLPRRVVSARLLGGGRIRFDETDSGLTLRLPGRAAGEYDTVVVLKLRQLGRRSH
ncbi:MAG TPA: alpha-L-fucosidase [Pyrinomonadaceae bacterium]